MEANENFPKAVILHNTGISYFEDGPNMAFASFILNKETQTYEVVGVIDQTQLGAEFCSMAYGTLLIAIPIRDLLGKLADATQGFIDKKNIPQE